METGMTAGFLGIGTMGRGMTENLLKAGFSVSVWNRTPEKADPLAARGARVAASPAEAASGAEVVFSMLADDSASRTAWLGPASALAAMTPGSVLVESSTVSPQWIAELHAAAEARGIRMIEAPVTGSRVQAEGGQLTFLAAGDAATLEQIKPMLRSMSKDILYLGKIGSGAQLKLINNFLCGVQLASFAQGLAWIERAGLERDSALEFLKSGAPGSGIFKAMSERMTHRNYEVNFLLRLMAKDMQYAQTAAAQQGIELTTARPAEQMLLEAMQQGYAEKDMSAIFETLRSH